MKRDILLKSGLGEEVLGSLRKEKAIEKLTKKLEDMHNQGMTYESMAREIMNTFSKKDDRYEDF